MAQREKGGRVVFIGNIPYGFTEEQICDTFSSVGRVVSFRLVYDKESGRPKGFGFLEYTNPDDAASAVRNLNDFSIMGRNLRVDYSNDNGGGGAGAGRDNQDGAPARPSTYYPPNNSNGVNANPAQQPPNGVQHVPADPAALPPLPSGAPLPPNLTAPDAISQTLSQIPSPQLLDILSQMKNLVNVNPAQATALLAQAPQLSYAIFQALLLLGLVDTGVLSGLIQQTAISQPQGMQQQAQQLQQPPPPQVLQQQPPFSYIPQQVPPQLPQSYTPQPSFLPPTQQPQPANPYAYPPQPSYPVAAAPTPQQPAYASPPSANPALAAPPPAGPPAAAMPTDPAQVALIQQVLIMPMEQVMRLDEGSRAQILGLKARFGGGVA